MCADRNTCLANAQIYDPKAQLCDEIASMSWLCDADPADRVYKFCHCKPPNPPQKPCPYGPNTPVPVYYDSGRKVCYCCCSCFAWGTPVAVPKEESEDGYKAIQLFKVNDQVLAAGTDLKWENYVVKHSDGVPPGPEYGKTMISFYYRKDEKITSLVVTPDHLFLLPNGKLKRAEKIVPGVDCFVAADGQKIEVIGAEVGGWFGGLHHIATSEEMPTSVTGHLLNSHGIVTGDWALQISNLEDGVLGDIIEHDDNAPFIATAQYLSENSHLEGDAFQHVVPGVNLDGARPEYFKPYRKETVNVPDFAKKFIREKQALDILYNAKQAPVISSAGKEIVYYLFRLMKGFYPDIHFDLVWEEELPNAYSWEEHGVKFVVINGGLVRTEGIGFNELAIVLGHEIGHLYGGAPFEGDSNYSCAGQADYAATSAVLNGVFFMPSMYVSIVPPGIEGINTFFSFISPENRQEIPGSLCTGPSTECRIKTLQVGAMGMGLPECAGGRKVVYLDMESAEAKVVDGEADMSEVTVCFNQPIIFSSAKTCDFYRFEPESKVLQVEKVPEQPAEVKLITTLEAGLEYKLFVSNVVSKNGDSFKEDSASVAVSWVEEK